MDNTTLYFSLAIIMILSFSIGVAIGTFLQFQNNFDKLAFPSTIVKTLSSKVISTIMIYGIVENISDRNITLTNQGESMTIGINTIGKVYTRENDVTEEIRFEDIKIGDTLNINASILPEGNLEGDIVYIFARGQ